jgi:iron complex transport system substrate-binding protein
VPSIRFPGLRVLAAVTVAVLAVTLAACSSSSDDAAGGDDEADAEPAAAAATDEDTFPVTVEHAFGETEITEAPDRVVTWGYSSADAAIALDVVPVAIPFSSYGGDDEGVLPWIREELEARGEDLPTILPNTEEPPFEAIAAAEPDLVIAAYSGITDEDYETLTQIAPTVAYPDEAWATPWREVIEIVGTSLGRSDEATALLADIDAQIAEQAAAHPELDGKTVAMVWDTPDGFYVYKPADARVEFATALGMVSAPSVDELATDESTFTFRISDEQLDRLTSDVLVNFADTPEQSQAFLTSARGQLMEQVARGTVAEVTGVEFITAVSPPTALSLTWGLDEYVSLLSEAALAADDTPTGA